MSARPVIVAGCGRSGTHWLGHIMASVFGPGGGAFEASDYQNYRDCVVDSRMRHRIKDIEKGGNRIVHLVRDGRDVVRSLVQWHGGIEPAERHEGSKKRADIFIRHCRTWTEALDMMAGYPYLRLEDLTNRKIMDAQRSHSLPHWRDWDDQLNEIFWSYCRSHMREYGYEEEG